MKKLFYLFLTLFIIAGCVASKRGNVTDDVGMQQVANSENYEAFTKTVPSKTDYPPLEIKLVEKSNREEKKGNFELFIALVALVVSIYSIFRDRKNKQFEMLHQSVASIKGLNRTIAGTISDLTQQKKTFLTELKNEYEFLAFLVNHKQIESRDVFGLEGEFLAKLVKDAKLTRDDYPEIFKLLARWKREKKKGAIKRILNSKYKITFFKRLIFKSNFCHFKG